MPVSVQVLFDTPQREVATLLRDRLARCRSASLISGFMTVEGIESIAAPLRAHPQKLRTLVVGAGTYKAYEAFDRLIAAGVPQDRLHVHLGQSRPTTSSKAQHSFYRYHPMLHSKVYLMEMPDGSASAFIGSHNLTGFALLGLNGEAATLIEGPSTAPEFDTIRRHIDESVAQSIQYQSGMKEAYSWWTSQFLEGLVNKASDRPADGENVRTIVILGAYAEKPLPKKDDLIYFELAKDIGRITTMKAEVHIYVFDQKPASPAAGLAQLDRARKSLWCWTKGLEDDKGGRELDANWFIESRTSPRLLPAPSPFRPRPATDMQQVRVSVRGEVRDRFEYLFESGRHKWEPVYNRERTLSAAASYGELPGEVEFVQPEDREWYLVSGLKPAGQTEQFTNKRYERALKAASPESGAYILLSPRRRILESE